MFNPDTTNEVRVRVVTNGHNSGAGRRYGQYNNEGSDDGVSSPDALSGTMQLDMVFFWKNIHLKLHHLQAIA